MPKKIRITKKELWNLDATLADIIHQYLVAFKAHDRHLVLYSPDYDDPNWDPSGEIRDETEWFLDELIWTFNYLARGDEAEEALISEVFDAESIENLINEGGMDFSTIRDTPKYNELRALETENHDRATRGLELFAKRFRSLWD